LLSFLIKNPKLKIAGVIIGSAMIKCPSVYQTNFMQKLVLNMIGEKEEVIILFYLNIKIIKFYIECASLLKNQPISSLKK